MKAIATVLIVMQLAACANIYEEHYNYRDGWRKGRVVQVATREQLSLRPDSDCTKGASADQQLALVSHAGAGSPVSHHVVLIPKNESFSAGDLIYVNIAHCDEPLVHRNAE